MSNFKIKSTICKIKNNNTSDSNGKTVFRKVQIKTPRPRKLGTTNKKGN